MTSKIYIKTCLSWLLGLIFFIALVNRVVDPFWYYQDIEIKGFNAVKPLLNNFERQFKPIILKDLKPEVVIFSNSFLEIGFNPKYPALTKDGTYRTYNFGMGSSSWERVFCNVIYASNNTQLKTAVIGIYPVAMPMPNCSEQLKNMGSVDIATLLFSYTALKSSYKTLVLQNKPPTQTKEGLLFYHRDKAFEVESNFSHYLSAQKMLYHGIACKPPEQTEPLTWSYPTAKSDMEGLKFLLQKLVKDNVQVKLVVYPFHALSTELAIACGKSMERWHNLYEIASVVEGINKIQPDAVELWDFLGMSDFNTEKILNNHVKYWQDLGHFNHEMGDVMLDTIFHRIQPNTDSATDEFGISLTPQTVPIRFERFLAKRKSFIAGNPWFTNELGRFIQLDP